MNVLVTGANGFVGRALCKRLLADGYQVRGEQRAESGERRVVLPSGVEGVQVGDIGPDIDWGAKTPRVFLFFTDRNKRSEKEPCPVGRLSVQSEMYDISSDFFDVLHLFSLPRRGASQL